MTGEKIKQVVAMYRKGFEKDAKEAGVPTTPRRSDVAVPCVELSAADEISHLLFMCDEIVKFIDAARMDKAFRWYGFLQGYLWVNGNYSIDQLGKHSMPTPEEEAVKPAATQWSAGQASTYVRDTWPAQAAILNAEQDHRAAVLKMQQQSVAVVTEQSKGYTEERERQHKHRERIEQHCQVLEENAGRQSVAMERIAFLLERMKP